MRSDIGLASALAVAGALTFSAADASAYCRTTTEGTLPESQCQIKSDQCCTVGKPLYWRNTCVGYSLQKNGTEQIALATAKSIIGKAFKKWSSITCPATGAPVSLAFQELEDVDCSEVRYNKETNVPNQNVIVFRDTQWTHSDTSETLGLTTVVFDPATGELFDADMEINTAQQTLTATDPIPPTGYDFDSIVTHEAGHFLGLAHTWDVQATMYAHYVQGSTTMRSLDADDVGGICSVYLAPDSQPGASNGRRATTDGGAVAAGTCDSTPRHGFSTECNGDSSDGSGCAVSPLAPQEPRERNVGVFAALGIVLSLGVARRTRASRRSAASRRPSKRK